MGWVSKREDEIERRDGEQPRFPVTRTADVFATARASVSFPTQQSAMVLDEAAAMQLDQIQEQLERDGQRLAEVSRLTDEAQLSGDMEQLHKAMKRWNKAQKAFRDSAVELAKFLAPRVRQMPTSSRKRSWQRTVAQLRQMRFLR